ncbi:DNA-binding protein, partial [Enterobacter ludwigii]
VCEEAIAYGLSGILVDYPRVSGKMNLAQEKAAGLRPYFVKISPTMLLDYKSKRIQGRETITHLRFVEYVQKSDPENEFSEETIEQ